MVEEAEEKAEEIAGETKEQLEESGVSSKQIEEAEKQANALREEIRLLRIEIEESVKKVVASVGDTVEDGDTLVILESMKMEIPVLAESAGTIAEIAVNEGDVVQEGDLIARVE